MHRLPENIAVALDRVSLNLRRGTHPFEVTHSREIESNWKREMAANPRLFDGQVAMFGAHAYRDGVLSADGYMVRFATLMYWRRHQPADGAEHFFAHAVPVARDGSLVAIRMASHTANPGLVYFAAGSFEAQDFRDGEADIEFNMAREVREETGLDLGATIADGGYMALRISGASVLFRRYHFNMEADEMARRVAAHVASDRDPEIDGAVVIRDACSLPTGLTSYMPGIIRWHFDNGSAHGTAG